MCENQVWCTFHPRFIGVLVHCCKLLLHEVQITCSSSNSRTDSTAVMFVRAHQCRRWGGGDRPVTGSIPGGSGGSVQPIGPWIYALVQCQFCNVGCLGWPSTPWITYRSDTFDTRIRSTSQYVPGTRHQFYVMVLTQTRAV